jgi:branched-chain amino acid transport system permease protein
MIVACVAPFLLSGFQTFQLTMVCVYAVAIVGLNLLTGYTGQISIGHGAFYAIGAFVVAILIDHFGAPYWLALLAVPFVCFGFGFVFGLPSLRLEGHYLALATFALAAATPQILKYKGLEDWTNGAQGISIPKPAVPFGLPISQDQWLYFFVLAVTLTMFWFASNLVRSHIGRAMMALRDHPIAASAMGVNTAFYKTMTFAISAVYCGVAGGLGAIAVQFVAPDSFDLFFSLTILIGVVVGGFATISGAIYGALFILIVPSVAAGISKSAPWVVYGVVLIVFMYAMPYGIAGLIRKITNRGHARPPAADRIKPSRVNARA